MGGDAGSSSDREQHDDESCRREARREEAPHQRRCAKSNGRCRETSVGGDESSEGCTCCHEKRRDQSRVAVLARPKPSLETTVEISLVGAERRRWVKGGRAVH